MDLWQSHEILERLTPARSAEVSRLALLGLHRATPRRKVKNMALINLKIAPKQFPTCRTYLG